MNNIFLQQEKAEELKQLAQNVLNLNPEQEKRFFELKRENDVIVKERESKLEKLKNEVSQLQVSISELFSVEQIRAVAIDLKLVPTRSSTPSASRSTNKWRESDKAEILISHKIGTGRGRPFTYRKGRIFEGIKEGEVTVSNPVYPKAQFPVVLLEFGTNEKDLLSIATEEGKKYFESKEGKEELEEIIHVTKKFIEENPDSMMPKLSVREQMASADAKKSDKKSEKAEA